MTAHQYNGAMWHGFACSPDSSFCVTQVGKGLTRHMALVYDLANPTWKEGSQLLIITDSAGRRNCHDVSSTISHHGSGRGSRRWFGCCCRAADCCCPVATAEACRIYHYGRSGRRRRQDGPLDASKASSRSTSSPPNRSSPRTSPVAPGLKHSVTSRIIMATTTSSW
ncbi:hypothetical protein NKDENANG_01710 [Candidatus Entotheonellaceae bacterium PAL068K]